MLHAGKSSFGLYRKGIYMEDYSSSRRLVKDLEPGEHIDQVFLIRETQLRTTRDGSFYIQAELGDRTGYINARFWDATADLFTTFTSSTFVNIKGRIELYRNEPQLIIDNFRPVEASTQDLGEFLASTEKDPTLLFERIKEWAGSIKEPYLARLLALFLEDTSFVEDFKKAPAAKEYHHSFLGGLLEHTVSIGELGLQVCQHYPQINRDLMLTGIILHDIGKIREISSEPGFPYTDEGELLGHVVMGVMMIEEKLKEISDFPGELRQKLLHLIISHHGEYEWGSPKLPMTLEAICLHYLDNLDAKMQAAIRATGEAEDRQSRWSERLNMFDRRRLYKGQE